MKSLQLRVTGNLRYRRGVMILIVVEQLPEGVWLATSPDVPGLIVQMQNRDDTIAEARQVARKLLELRQPFEYMTGGTTKQ